MKEPTLTRYPIGDLILMEDGEGDFSIRDENKIERDEKQKCVIQVERKHDFADGAVDCICRATFFDMIPDLTQYNKDGILVGFACAHYDVERKTTIVDFKNNPSPSQVIKGAASVLGAHTANAFLELSQEDQKNRSMYAAQAWGKSDLGEIPFMMAFWEVFASRARG